MSIISSEAKWAVLQRVVRLSHEEIRGTTNGKEYEAGFIAGATRQPTDEEIEAVAETVWNKVMVPNGHRPWADTQECVMKADFIDVARTALETAQGKATEE